MSAIVKAVMMRLTRPTRSTGDVPRARTAAVTRRERTRTRTGRKYSEVQPR
jgi:hypothetical protein